MTAILYAQQAIKAARDNDLELSCQLFLMAHATRHQGEKEFVIPVSLLFQFFRKQGVELSEEELKELLSKMEATGEINIEG